ncbi:branched-chain amino acid ABC transporter substrate-binding protein, partial [Mesorhizobium sp. ZC-5]|nr:branched-chain amino acid ABC transporter substrate-binding protein [Mesorhizobium sp. ZC-5]
MRHLTAMALSALLALLPASMASAQTSKPEPIDIRIGYLRAYAPSLALSVLDVPPRDEGVAGGTVAIADNNTTG